MRNRVIVSASLAGLVLLCLGCPVVEDSRGDMVDDDSPGDATDATDVAEPDATPAHAFLVAPVTSACEPVVCEVDGDAYSEFKAWNQGHGCEPAPQDLLCRMKTQQLGLDWPAQARGKIEAASVVAGGFSEAQKAALRCLAYMEPSQEFDVRGGEVDSRSPSRLRLGLQLDLPGDAEAVAAGFLARLGPYIGAAYGVTPDFDLQTMVTSYAGYPGASGGVNIRVVATTYKGIRLLNAADFEVTLLPVTDIGSSPEQTCAGRYRTDDQSSGSFDHRLAEVRIDEEGRVPLETAVQGALAACGPTCWALADPKAQTFLTRERLLLQVQLGCPSHCKAYPNWTCTYTVDAFTGEVLGGGEDCCVDCWDE